MTPTKNCLSGDGKLKRERETDRQTDRQTETDRDRQTETDRDRDRQRQTERGGKIWVDRSWVGVNSDELKLTS